VARGDKQERFFFVLPSFSAANNVKDLINF